MTLDITRKTRRRISGSAEKTLPEDESGYLFKVGETYLTQEGEYVRVEERYHRCILCSDGLTRYDRRYDPFDAGRVVGSPPDYSDSRNFQRADEAEAAVTEAKRRKESLRTWPFEVRPKVKADPAPVKVVELEVGGKASVTAPESEKVVVIPREWRASLKALAFTTRAFINPKLPAPSSLLEAERLLKLPYQYPEHVKPVGLTEDQIKEVSRKCPDGVQGHQNLAPFAKELIAEFCRVNGINPPSFK